MDAPTPSKRNGCSRLFHCTMAVVYLVVLLTAVISLGAFATKQNEIASIVPDLLTEPKCVLFVSYSGKLNPDKLPKMKLGQDATCLMSIWGEAALAFASLGMFIFAVVLACTGTPASSSWLVVVKLVLLTLCTLLALSVSSVISLGLSQTCKGFDDGANASPTESPGACQGYAFIPPDSELHYFYSQINTAKSAAWVGTILLIIVVIVYIILLIWRACVRKPQRSTEMFEPLRESEEDFAEVSGFKKV